MGYEEEELTSEEIIQLLNLAVENDRVDIVKEMLLQYPNYLNGIPFSSQQSQKTPLHISIINGSISTLNCLLRMGANPYHNNIKSFTYVSKKEFDIKQAFFMELVRVMNIGYIDRIIDILNCGYIPDNSIIDWIPEEDGNENGLEDKI